MFSFVWLQNRKDRTHSSDNSRVSARVTENRRGRNVVVTSGRENRSSISKRSKNELMFRAVFPRNIFSLGI